MGEFLKNKRWLALFMAMMVIFSFSLSVGATGGQVRTMRVRKSGDYSLLGTIRIEADYDSVSSCKTGSITFLETIRINGTMIVEAGAEFRYQIKPSVKDGATVTLKYEEWCGAYTKYTKMTGKIHVEGHDNRFLWKMDSFGTGFYFRHT